MSMADIKSREAAFASLESEHQDTRLRGARFLALSTEQADLPILRRFLHRERVPYIRAALLEAIARASMNELEDAAQFRIVDVPDEIAGGIRADAVRNMTRLLVHEIEPIIGELRLVAAREVGNFEGSETKQKIERLLEMAEAIARLGQAASPPRIEDLELSALVDEIVSTEGKRFSGKLKREGPRPFVIRADKTFLKFAITNGLRNAIEATADLSKGDERGQIVISWEKTDRDCWLSIIDDGIGCPASVTKAFEFGTTTKPGHFGVGLAIAKQAVESMHGTINLRNERAGETCFEISWPGLIPARGEK
jgi:signal transduction histidine kinase